MDPIIQQPPQEQVSMDSAGPRQVPESKHFLNKKFAITLVILLLLGTGAYAGIWYWGNQQVAQEVAPTFTPRPSAVATGTKTYKNIKYGFEIQIPNDWTVVEGNDSLAFKSQETITAEAQNAIDCSPGSTKQCNSDGVFPDMIFQPSSDIKDAAPGSAQTKNISGLVFTNYIALGMIEVPTYEINYKNKVYNFGSLGMSQVNFEKILSTFKFTDSTGSGQAGSADTSTWKTYTNTQYGFKLKHPAAGEVYNTSTSLGEEFKFYVGGNSAVAIVLKTDSTTFCPKWSSYYSNSSYNPCSKTAETPLLTKTVGVIKYSFYCVAEGGMGEAPPLTLSDKEICKKVSETFTTIAREPISTWKTYRSTLYGIEFKYPSGLCLKEGVQEPLSGSSGLGLFLGSCPVGKYDPYTTRRYLQNLGPEFIGISLIKDRRPVKEQLDPSAPYEQIVKNGISGYYAPNTLFMERTGPTVSTSRWLFSSPTGYSILIEDKPEITNQILSTFKFTQ